jgi:hypothetical protein
LVVSGYCGERAAKGVSQGRVCDIREDARLIGIESSAVRRGEALLLALGDLEEVEHYLGCSARVFESITVHCELLNPSPWRAGNQDEYQ